MVNIFLVWAIAVIPLSSYADQSINQSINLSETLGHIQCIVSNLNNFPFFSCTLCHLFSTSSIHTYPDSVVIVSEEEGGGGAIDATPLQHLVRRITKPAWEMLTLLQGSVANCKY